jgi:aminopeptidase N
MRKGLLFTLCLSILLSGFSQFDEELKHHSEDEINRYTKSIFQTDNIFNYHYDIVFHRIEHSVNPNQNYISGSVTSYFVPDANFGSTIRFDFSHAFTVNAILYHGDTVSYNLANYVLEIFLQGGPTAGQIDSVRIEYEGVPGGQSGFVQDYHGPLSPNVPIIYTNSEPYWSRDWWPCKQSLSDKIDSIDIILTMPQQYKSASNGLIVSDVVDAGKRTTHWKHRYPIVHYLVAYTITNYQFSMQKVEMPNGDSLEIHNYLWPEDYNNHNTPSDIIIDIMQFYNQKFLPYPYSDEKYGQATWTRNGAMENQTMTFTGNYTTTLMAHELAHHWFGNYVTCGSWPEIWLNESFATFAAAIVLEELFDESDWLNWKTSTITSVTNQLEGSVFVYDTVSASNVFNYRMVYQKGAIMLNMLRWELGDEDFYQGIQNYLLDTAIAHKFASSDQLIQHWEDEGDTSLTGFFADWLYGQGYPQYDVVFNQDNLNQLSVNIQQTTTHPSVEFFEMHVPIRFSGLTEDTILIFHHTVNDQDFMASLGFEVTDAAFDPDKWLLTRYPTINGMTSSFSSKGQFIIYPNPATKKILINCPGDQPVDLLEIYDASGKLVHQELNIYAPDGNMEMDITFLKPGKYFVSASTSIGKWSGSFIKE